VQGGGGSGQAGTSGAAGSTQPPGETEPGGCACVVASHDRRFHVAPLLLAGLALILRRRRR